MTDARKRTLDRKKALLAAAAALEIACSKSNSSTDMGYAVVDPMPQPARCPDLESALKPTGKFLPDGTVELTIPSPPQAAGTLAKSGAAPVVTGATLVKTTTTPTTTVLILKTAADAGPINADVEVHGSCTGTPDVTLHVRVDIRPPDVTINVYEQRY